MMGGLGPSCVCVCGGGGSLGDCKSFRVNKKLLLSNIYCNNQIFISIRNFTMKLGVNF